MPRFDAVLFDLDGTLLDTLTDMHMSMQTVLDRLGLPRITREQTRAFVGSGIPTLVRRVMAAVQCTDEAMFDVLLREYLAEYDMHRSDHTAPYAGIDGLLNGLHAAGVPGAIITNKNQTIAEQLCRGFFPTIGVVMGGESGYPSKPENPIVLAAMEKLGVDPKRCVYVGDSDVDVLTARNANLPCACCTWGFRSPEQLRAAGGEMLFDTPNELLQWLLMDAEA